MAAADVRARLQQYRQAKGDGGARCPACGEGVVVDGQCKVCVARPKPSGAPAADDTPRQPDTAAPPVVARAQERAHEFLAAPGPLGWRRSAWLKLVLWILLAVVCWELAAMPIYFILLTLFAIVQLTEDNRHRRRPGQLSAYAVFNKNFEKITGTFDGEQVDSFYRRGGMYGRS